MTGKILGIGLSRTGTSTLVKAFGILGFKAIHFPLRISDFTDYDAAADTSVAGNFVGLDKMFPGSRFVYTTRDIESWLESYDTTTFDAEKFAAAYRRHDAHVRDYFANRPGDWMEFDICGGEGDWPPLCEFLSCEIPSLPFPWSNRGDAVDQMLIRALHVMGDVALVSRIASVSTVHLNNLKQTARYADHDVSTVLDYDDSAETLFLASRLCQAVGGLDEAAETLGLAKGKADLP